MGSYVSVWNNTAWPLVMVCITSNWVGPPECYEYSCYAGKHCLLPGHTFDGGKWSLSHDFRATARLIGEYGTETNLYLPVWTGPTANSRNLYRWRNAWPPGGDKYFHEMEPLLNRVTALKKATIAGISYGETFCTSLNSSFSNLSLNGRTLPVVDEVSSDTLNGMKLPVLDENGKTTVVIIKEVFNIAGTGLATVSAGLTILKPPSFTTSTDNLKFVIPKQDLLKVGRGQGSLSMKSSQVSADGTLRSISISSKVGKVAAAFGALSQVFTVISAVLTFFESPAPAINYGLISHIVFKETSRAISEHNYVKITSDTATAITKLKDAMNHIEDSHTANYIQLLRESESFALKAYNDVALISFPPEFEWWRPVIYMQLTTIRLIALVNLHALEVNNGENNWGFLRSAQDCSEKARRVLNSLIEGSKQSLTHWFHDEVADSFQRCVPGPALADDARKISALKTKYETSWDKLLNPFQ